MDNSQPLIKLVNQIYELEKKILSKKENTSLTRNFDRIHDSFAELGLMIYNPMGEPYNETRTDCEASLAGNSADELVITEVIKPVIYFLMKENEKHLVQRAVVIVEKKS